MRRRLERIRRYLKVSRAHEIARRLFIMNAFDGTLTMIGVILGAQLSGAMNPKVVITAGVGGSLATGISGASGAYMAERAERKRDLGKLETAMLADLEDTRYARASRLANLVIALVDRIGPALCALVLILPFALVPHVSLETAFYASLSLGLAILFLLGAFLARISEERPVVTGLQMIGVGIITILLVSLLLH